MNGAVGFDLLVTKCCILNSVFGDQSEHRSEYADMLACREKGARDLSLSLSQKKKEYGIT